MSSRGREERVRLCYTEREPGVFIIALVLGYLVKKTGSIWPGTLLHTLNNCLTGAL